MRLYQFNLPTRANDGASYREAVAGFKRDALEYTGGYSDLGKARGAWRDPKDAADYLDQVRVIQIACEPHKVQWFLEAMARRFPDQEAYFYADLGEAVIARRVDIV